MKLNTEYWLILFFVGNSTSLLAQVENRSKEEHNNNSSHSITLVIANMLVPNSFADNTNDIIVVPTFGFNYDYRFKSNWGLGIHTDIILQEYTIEKHGNNEVVVRENPVSISGILFYKPHHKWGIWCGNRKK